ncbi:MAG TPA: hypothetical protein EYP62_01235, partial [Kiritimatiellae bacterium]|nr:hypothetical protein [Kiritimatiellia bacterium]
APADLGPGAHLLFFNRRHGAAVYSLAADGLLEDVMRRAREGGMQRLSCVRYKPGPAVFRLEQAVVRPVAGSPPDEIRAAVQRLGGGVLRPLGRSGLYLVSAGTNQMSAFLSRLRSLPMVEWAEADYLRQSRPKFLPPDPLFTNQWSLHNTGQGGGMSNRDVYAQTAWDITRGTSAVVIAVLDDGFDIDHEDLNPVLYSNSAEVADGADNDGNGYTDDLYGWDFHDNDNDPRPVTADENHGTAVLGSMIAAVNGTGVVGIAHQCRFLPLRVFGEFYTDSDVAEALDYAARTAGVIAICYYLDPSETIFSAIRRATALGRNGKGCLVCCALGNDGVLRRYSRDLSASPEVLTVSGLSNYDRRSWFADFGPPVEAMAAAGGGSLALATTDRRGSGGYADGDYYFEWEGTSASAPIVAGIAALLFCRHPDWTALQVRRALVESCDPTDWRAQAYTNEGKSLEYGFGRANAHAALLYEQEWTDEYEPDDSWAAASAVCDGRLQFRSLPSGDQDWVYFDLAQTSDVRVTAVGATGIVVTLYDSSLTAIAAASPSPFTVLTRSNMAPGRYYAALTATGTAAVGRYALHFGILNLRDGYEPDDSSANASLIQPGRRQHHTFYPSGDQDWATFTLTNSAYVEILTLGEIDGDTILWLYDAGLNPVASNDDESSYTYYSYLATQLNAGQYFIRLKEYSDDPLEAYSLILEIHRPDDYEPNNSLTQATWISSGQRLACSLFPSGDVDWFGFTLSNDAAVLLLTDSSNPYSVGDTYLSLYSGGTNHLIAENDDGNSSYFSAIFEPRLTAGVYYVRVHGVAGYPETIETNPNHYLALDIFDAAARFTNITRAPEGIALQWSGDAAWHYRLEDFDGSDWVTRTNLEGRVGPNSWVDTAPGVPAPAHWYRLSTQ